jgi:adenylate cyclase
MDKTKLNTAVLFFDRKGFYKQSQGKDAARLAEELDEFYKEVIDSAAEYRGSVIKFMGDAGILLFDSTDDAVRFARALVKRQGYDSNIGVEYGEVVKGTFGKAPLQWVDVIGTPVNEAAVNLRRAARGDRSIVLGPRAWEALTIDDREDIARAE